VSLLAHPKTVWDVCCFALHTDVWTARCNVTTENTSPTIELAGVNVSYTTGDTPYPASADSSLKCTVGSTATAATQNSALVASAQRVCVVDFPVTQIDITAGALKLRATAVSANASLETGIETNVSFPTNTTFATSFIAQDCTPVKSGQYTG
jgi:hypothetical protein